MVAPALITAAWNMVGAPQEWKELPPESAVLLVEFGADDARRTSTPRSPRRSEILASPRDDPADRLHPRAGGDRARLAGARGPARADRQAAPAGHGADRRGRLRAAGADRRGRPRPAGAARRARLPARRRRPRLGREPALHAHPGLRQAGGPRALRGLHGRPGRADRRQVRRLAQGRARDRDQHGPLCGARVGGEGDRADVAGEAARRPRRRARARRRPQPRPRRPPAQPEDDAADRGVGDDLRRVRLLRAGLPEPQPDDDAAPADRPAAGDGAPAEPARRCSGRCSRSTSTTRSRPAPPTAPASSPARSGSTPASWSRSCAASAHGERAERLALAAAKRWGAVEGASRAGAAARRAPGAADQARQGRCRAARRPPASCRRRLHEGAAASTSPPASTASSAPLRRRAANVQTAAFGPSTGWWRRWSRSRRGPGCRSGSPTTSPGAAAGCRGARKGFGDAHRHKANEMVERLWGWSGEGALPVVVDAASCTQARSPSPATASSTRRTPSASPSWRSSTRSPGRTTACCPGSRSASKVGSATVHPTCATRHLGLAPACASLAGALADEVYVAPSATCCGFAGDRGISHPELTAAATAPRPTSSPAADFDAHLSSNRTCEIGLEPRHRRALRVGCPLLERLTRTPQPQPADIEVEEVRAQPSVSGLSRRSAT